ncbi:MAG: Crp/Fnr family transcriptional regulator [Acidobacteria bacterium]|nr:Crp/Fnr family transcriptional regulator [Acidobacteriota bacterium]
MSRIGNMSTMETVKTHQPIYFPDEPSRAIFFLKEGHVKISRITSDGKEVILDIIGPGEIFGEVSLSDEEGTGRNEIAHALDDVVICTVKKEDFEKLLKMTPALNLEVTKRIGLRLRKIEERITDLVFKDSRRRIASFLVRHAEEFGKIKGGIVVIKAHLTHQDIALLTGSARQTVTTTLNEFRALGLLDFSRSDIKIMDLDRLRDLAA